MCLFGLVFGLNAGKLDAKVLCIDGDCRLVWPSGSSTDSTLDVNVDASASWVSKSHDWNADQNFSKVNVLDLNIFNSGFVLVGDNNYSFSDLNLSVINVCSGDSNSFLNNVGECIKITDLNFGGGSGISEADANALFYKQIDLNSLIQVGDFNHVWLSQLDGNLWFVKVEDSNSVSRLIHDVIADWNLAVQFAFGYDLNAVVVDLNSLVYNDVNVWIDNKISALSLVDSTVDSNVSARNSFLGQSWSWVHQVFGSVQVFDFNLGSGNIQSNDLNYSLVDLNYSVNSQCSGDANSVLTSSGACQDITGFDTGGTFNDTTIDVNVDADASYRSKPHDWNADNNFSRINVFDLNAVGYNPTTDLNNFFARLFVTGLSSLLYDADFNSMLSSIYAKTSDVNASLNTKVSENINTQGAFDFDLNAFTIDVNAHDNNFVSGSSTGRIDVAGDENTFYLGNNPADRMCIKYADGNLFIGAC